MEKSFADFAAEYTAQREAFRNKYTLNDYLSWMMEFMARKELEGFTDDEAAYWSDVTSRDKEMAGDLRWLAERVKSIGEVNEVKCERSSEDEEFWRFSYSDAIYAIGTVSGQGSFTYIHKIDVSGPALDLEPYTKDLLSEQTAVWTRNWFRSNGRETAVLGVSGGKDSAVVAGICEKALGADRVYGVLMPNGEQPDIADSIAVVESLGIKSGQCNIEPAYKAICKCVEEATGIPISHNAAINVGPRVRMAVLYAIAQTLSDVQSAKACVVGTGNRGEAEVGYTTKWGDSACDVNPIRGLWVDEVLQIGDELPAVPAHIVHKAPSDGLCGETDEERLGVSYDDVRRVMEGDAAVPEDVARKVRLLHKRSEHKRASIPLLRK